jgi:hypothetical protein
MREVGVRVPVEAFEGSKTGARMMVAGGVSKAERKSKETRQAGCADVEATYQVQWGVIISFYNRRSPINFDIHRIPHA